MYKRFNIESVKLKVFNLSVNLAQDLQKMSVIKLKLYLYLIDRNSRFFLKFVFKRDQKLKIVKYAPGIVTAGAELSWTLGHFQAKYSQ